MLGILAPATRELFGDRFYDLLEASAQTASRSIHLLAESLKDPAGCLPDLSSVRQEGERLAAEITAALARTIMASLQRDDIQALSGVLRAIPKRVDAFAGRYRIAGDRAAGQDFLAVVDRLEEAADTLLAMVQQLRVFANLTRIPELDAHLAEVTDAAESHLENLVHVLYQRSDDPLHRVIAKDLADQAQFLIEACRDAGARVAQVTLKYA